MEIDEPVGQGAVTNLIFAQKRAQCQRSMSRSFLLDRDADPERRMSILSEGRKTLAKSARTGEQVHNTESGRQIGLLTKIVQPLYTRFRDKNQGAVTDIVDKQTRSLMMAGIRGKDTKPELALRRALHARGFRYRLHAKQIPGRPDIVFPKYRAVIFVHGCFWHRHAGCRYATTPATRPDFWQAKFAANVARDQAVRTKLLQSGWRVATVWECALRKPEQTVVAVELLSTWLVSNEKISEIE